MEKIKHKTVPREKSEGRYRLALEGPESEWTIWGPNGESEEEMDAEFQRLLAQILKNRNAPGGRAWTRVNELMCQAKTDPAITDNPGAVEFLDVMQRLTKYAFSHWDVEMVLKPVTDLGASKARSNMAKKAADVTHTENRSMKAEVFTWLAGNRATFKSKEKAAEAVARLQPIAHRTAYKWITEWEKLQSASTL